MMKFTSAGLTFSFITTVLCYTEEAPYTVLKNHGTWEERSYPPTKWVSTQGLDASPHEGPNRSAAFWRLFGYLDGGNSEEMKIPMTAPVSNMILPGEGSNPESNFTLSFLIPSNLQENTPVPTDPIVYIEDRPEMRFASLNFTGFPSELTWTMKTAELYQLAVAEGLNVKDTPLWSAGYSGPSVIINRRNEVWLEI